jgi:hypothetical protein
MIAGLPIGFTSPLLLLALLALPILWWLLRLVPPRPRRIAFPPTRILMEIEPKEETPARTPWWLTLLRLVLAALIIIAAAGPIWNPPLAGTRESGPIVLLVDSGWTAAAHWNERMRAADAIVTRAETESRGIAVIGTGAPAKEFSLLKPSEAREALRLLAPSPHTPDRSAIVPPLERLLRTQPALSVVWLSDGVDLGDGTKFVAELRRLAPDRVTVVSGGIEGALALTAADNAAGALTVKVLRAETSAPSEGTVRARDLRGLALGDATFTFSGSATETDATFDLPVEIRNDIARLEILGERSAGAVQLLDKRWRRRTVGVISGGTADTSQPLLAATYYLSRALGPFSDVRISEIASPSEAVTRFAEQRLPVMVLSDVGTIVPAARQRLGRWIEEGGVLVRFAGRRLAAATEDDLVPVRLRRGGRVLGGSLSWEQPQKLGSYSREGPFHDLAVPDDVTVTRQVLAEPDGRLAERTWASLADGTPLVTAEKRGRGLVVLFHVTADTAWSNLPISGAFVDMLRRIVALAGTTATTADAKPVAERGTVQTVAPTRLLDGFGVFAAPGPTAKPVPADYAERAVADHPPGFYGPSESLLAVNTLAAADRLKPLDLSAFAGRIEPYRQGEPTDLRGYVLSAIVTLILLDALIVLVLAGGLARITRRRVAAAALRVGAILVAAGEFDPLAAQDNVDMQAVLQTRLAYVVTGDAEVDNVSRAGLQGLSIFLQQRTAIEPGDPMGVDIARDELAFFPMLYWPITPTAAQPDQATLARIDAYMKQGGTILFDTRDAFSSVPGRPGEVSPSLARLREIMASLDIPELEPVPLDHVLTKAFYLLRDFPGRFTNGTTWVEALTASEDETRPARAGDGVSPIIIVSNDLAGAWAVGRDGQPLLPLVPGEPRQREFAFRAGVNIVMYILTGNYKADLVHVPAMLERLGQ